jgi:hypothetical protein
MLWYEISCLPGCESVTPPKDFPRLFLLETPVDDTRWLIGRYCDLTRFATALRHDDDLRAFVTSNKVRLGLRDSDVPPAEIKRQERYGTLVRGDDYNQVFTAKRSNVMAEPVHPELAPPVNRRTDREENVKQFWESQTPQSHHIVEFNNLETLGVSRERGCTEMDYQQLPAVLLAAEFHQRYISAILKPAQRWGKKKLQTDIASTYRNLYLTRSKLFEPLWEVSRVILEEAGIKGP